MKYSRKALGLCISTVLLVVLAACTPTELTKLEETQETSTTDFVPKPTTSKEHVLNVDADTESEVTLDSLPFRTLHAGKEGDVLTAHLLISNIKKEVDLPLFLSLMEDEMKKENKDTKTVQLFIYPSERYFTEGLSLYMHEDGVTYKQKETYSELLEGAGNLIPSVDPHMVSNQDGNETVTSCGESSNDEIDGDALEDHTRCIQFGDDK